MRIAFVALLVVFASFAQAQAADGKRPRLTLYAGASYTLPMYALTSGASVTNTTGLGYLDGLSYEIPFGKSRFGLELGAFFGRQAFALTSSGTTVTNEINVLSAPVLLRVWLFKDSVSLGLGGYGHTLLLTTASGARTTDLGLAGSVKFGLFKLKKGRIFLDLRAKYGLLNLATTGTETLKLLDLQALVGFGF